MIESTGLSEPRRREFSSLVATLLPRKTRGDLLQTKKLFQLAIAICENKIDFYCDIRDIDFAFITDNDITSILGNLLENSLESVINATQKIIELKIKPLNKNYIVISIWNTCSSPPLIKNHRIYSTKHNKEIHGFGIASVSRVAKSYGGNIDYNYDDDGMIFSVQVLLPVQNNHQ